MSTYGTNRSQGTGGGGGGGGANQHLSNLIADTAINVDLLPRSNASINLGSIALAWNNGYFANAVFSPAYFNTAGSLGVFFHGAAFAPDGDLSLAFGESGNRINGVHTAGLILYGATSGAITLAAANATTDYTVTWPNAQGGANTFPMNDGSGNLSWETVSGSGTVTSVSVVSANGLAGTVATDTTTPAITLSTTITGILQGNGTAISAATVGALTAAGTDGIAVTSGTGAVLGSGTSIAQHVADTTHNGYLSSTDWNTFNGKQAALTIGNLTDAGTDGITVTGGTGAVIGSGTSIAQHVADATHNGYLSSTDWSTFNGKQASGNYITALTGDVTASGPGSVTATIAAGAVSLAKMANLAANSIIGNNTGSPATPIALTAAQVGTLLALPGNATALKAPTVTSLTANGTQTGWLFNIATSSTVAVGDTYTNNAHTFTVQGALTAQSGFVLFVSGTGTTTTTGTDTLTRATGSGTASITFNGSTKVATATYTTPTSPAPLYLRIRAAGGGGGGGGSATSGSGGNATDGSFTYVGPGPNYISLGGGGGGTGSGNASGGGAASLGTAPIGVTSGGNAGFVVLATSTIGGQGAPSPLFGGSPRGRVGAGVDAAANSGAGGSGAGGGSTGAGGGGASGATCDVVIGAPPTTLVYAIGSGGGAGTAGTGGNIGGVGGSGIIVIEERYQ